MTVDNDTRGWIMTVASGVACVLGASIICVDIIIQQFPRWRSFRIQDSNYFLSSSLSLSFGVMLFSALNNMLPSAKSSLQKGGFSPQAAAWTLIACFIAGVVGIQVISRVLHHYMPSHVVDCDHSHGEEEEEPIDPHGDHFSRHHQSRSSHSHPHSPAEMAMRNSAPPQRPKLSTSRVTTNGRLTITRSLSRQFSRVAELVPRAKSLCDDHATPHGECKGYSEPCGFECFKIVQARGGSRLPSLPNARHPGLSRSATTPHAINKSGERQPLLEGILETSPASTSKPSSLKSNGTMENSYASLPAAEEAVADPGVETDHDENHDDDNAHDHHHHVPTNAFMSIGLQTSIAIALHKLPEGFITYATNHANPKLGLSVFMALFIHNITEGFAMALPLYLAINSRWKAMLVSSILGGASQPLGAGVAALWFHLAGSTDAEPGEGVYGGMFAVTAGIMASVALQLFSESLDLTHNRNLCMAFAFVGMTVLGVSSALTAG